MTPGTDGLIPWLHQVLNTVEHVACGAQPERDELDREHGTTLSAWEDPNGEFQGRRSSPVFAHVLRHSPERVVRQVAADRRILAEYERLLFRDPLRVGPAWDARRDTWEMAVRMRAEAYDDQPGYREVWRQCPTA